MQSLFAAKPWQKTLLLALGLFLLTRALMLSAFPIFNDEAIYIQYSQEIHDNWAKNKFISMDSPYDWKPPLQYWLTSPFIRWGHDPLITGRLLAQFVSLLGFFGFYLFVKELFGVVEGVICAWLYVLCPPVLFHNDQFIAETFLFSTAPFLYWAILRGTRPGARRWLWAIPAALIATALLLFKQSALLMLGVSVFLPCSRLLRSPNEDNFLAVSGWKEFAKNLGLVAVVIIGAQLAARALLPTAFDATRDRINNRWVMSPQELFRLPTHLWRANVSLVSDYIGAYYSWFVPVFFATFLWLAFRRKNLGELALASMGLTGAAAVIFNTAVIVALLPILARAIVLIWSLTATGPSMLMRRGLLVFVVIMLADWSYQVTLMGISPGKYIEQSTPWAVTNYLQSWSTGFGVKEVVAMLEREKQAGVLLLDSRRGNPCIALEVYARERFPNLQMFPVLPKLSDPMTVHRIGEEARKLGSIHLAIFSADSSEDRPVWQAQVERELCADRTEVKAYPAQMPIVVCRF
jgi:hypothetical protein